MRSGLILPWTFVRHRLMVTRRGAFEFGAAEIVRFLLLFLVAGQLARVPIASAGAKEAPLLVNDVVLGALILTGVLAAVRYRTLRLDRVALLALLFAAIGGIGVIGAVSKFGLSAFDVAFSFAYLGRWCAYFLIYVFITNFVASEDRGRIWTTLERVIIAFAAFGILQSIFLPGFAQILYPEAELYTQWDPQGRRLVSTFLDPNLAGGLLLVGLMIQLGRTFFGAEQAGWKIALLAVATALTVSRSTTLGVLAGGLVLIAASGLSKRGLRVAMGSGFALLLAGPFVLSMAIEYNKLDLADPSLLLRFVAWGQAVVVLLDNMFIGVGFNTYGFVHKEYGFGELMQSSFGLDGGLLFIAVMTGLLGVIVYTSMIGTILRRCRREWRDTASTPTVRGMAAGTAAATVGILVHSLFVNSLLYPFLMEVLWVLWALVAIGGGTEEPADSCLP
ncbi:MAG: O-antigen ligase family protein [Gemmatimonadales bacterium]|mgnify:CR=1 FL=1|nr:O-antigen ligase family protein [Gemmatimonadales bacterium]MBT4436086.1 O-antigen ligase family protein [Gemmatimonadales bacterium]MBT5045342.1 O-antigen ligase family protein [Gemmatimonadales bacterium]MBT6373245.1 O-antigen ligase family protein [Gemmatimonadales bacterium]